MENDNEKNNITRKDLDKRFEEQTQSIITAVDAIMEKRTKEVRDELYIVRNELKEEIQETKTELKRDINNTQKLIDCYVKAQEDFKQEFVIMKEEIKQVKNAFKEKLGVEISAIWFVFLEIPLMDPL